jgi:hypothetical protein
MVWSLISLGTGLSIWGLLWLQADVLEKRAAKRKEAETPVQNDLSYEED